MAEQFDPEWEYRVSDIEIEEVIYTNGLRGVNLIDVCFGSWEDVGNTSQRTGMRYGNGDPDSFTVRNFASAKPGRPPAAPIPSRRCKKCDRLFFPVIAGRVYCGRPCKRERVIRPCETCLQMYTITHKKQRYCSRDCITQALRSPTVIFCKQCGKEKLCKYIVRTFCSKRCSAEYGNNIIKALLDRESERIQLEQETGKIFKPCPICRGPIQQSTNRNGVEKVYCSRRCTERAAARRHTARKAGRMEKGVACTKARVGHLSPIQRKMVDVLQDGKPHLTTELLACLSENITEKTRIAVHLMMLRKRLKLMNPPQYIACVVINRKWYYVLQQTEQ